MLTYNNLLSEIRSLMQERNIVSIVEQEEDAGTKDVRLAKQSLEELLGAMTIDIKKWGSRPENPEDAAQERKIIQSYVGSASKGGTPDQILASLQASFEGLEEEGACDPQTAGNCNMGKLVSQIQLLNTMSRILTNFGSSEAGFIMEALLSAMFPGGKVVPVGSGTIADFFVKVGETDAGYSLKTIDEKRSVEGSVTELVKSITPEAPMIYYIFAKSKSSVKEVTDKITVWKFEINYNNVSAVINKPQEVIDEIRASGNSQQEMDALRAKFRGFTVSPGKYKKLAGGNPVAVLTLDPRKLLAKAECELQDIKQQLIDIQTSYKKLVYDMNQYLATMSNTAASSVKGTTDEFSKVVAQNVQGDETCES